MYAAFKKKNNSKQHLKIALAIFTCIVAFSGVALGALAVQRIWERSFETAFTIATTDVSSGGSDDSTTPPPTGTIQAGLYSEWWKYQTLQETTRLIDGSTILTLTKCTVTTPISIDIKYSAEATLTCMATYVQLYRAADVATTAPVGEPFSIAMDGSPTELLGKLLWHDPYTTGSVGYGLLLTFSLVTDGLPAGIYPADISIGLSA